MLLADKIPDVILAACILHNFAMVRDEDHLYNCTDNNNDDQPVNLPFEDTETEENSATIKRDYIANILK